MAVRITALHRRASVGLLLQSCGGYGIVTSGSAMVVMMHAVRGSMGGEVVPALAPTAYTQPPGRFRPSAWLAPDAGMATRDIGWPGKWLTWT